MNKPKFSPQRTRERAVFLYRSALERGDFDTVVAVLKMAEHDTLLMQMIEETAELDEEPAQRPEKQVSSFYRQAKGITQSVIRRDPSPDGSTPKSEHYEEESKMQTVYSDTVRRGKYGLSASFPTVIAASIMFILLSTLLYRWISEPIRSYGTLIEPSATPSPAGCEVLKTNDLQAESIRLAEAGSTVLAADQPDTEIATLLGICALQTAYSPEADTTLQDALEQADLLPLLKGHQASLFTANFSPDGQYIVTASWDGTARLWDAATLTEIRKFEQLGFMAHASFSPDGQYILTSGGTVRLWETATGNLLHTFGGHSNVVTTAVFSPDGKYGLSASHDGTARLWNLVTGEEVRTFEMPSSSQVDQAQTAIFSPDGSRIIVDFNGPGESSTLLQEFSTETGEPIRQFTGSGTTRYVWGMDISADGRYLLATGDGGTTVLDYQTAQEIHYFSDGGNSSNWDNSMFSPDGRLILVATTAAGENVLHLLDAETGLLIRTFIINAGRGAFSPDGRQIATASNTRGSGGNPNATVYATDYHDFIAYACSKVTRDFTAEERAQYGLSNSAPTCPQFGQSAELPPGMTAIPTQPIPVWTPIPTIES